VPHEIPFDLVQDGPHLTNDQPIGASQVDVRYLPVEDRAIVFDQASEVGRYLLAATLQFNVFDVGHGDFPFIYGDVTAHWPSRIQPAPRLAHPE
jgi:hypothetical protein